MPRKKIDKGPSYSVFVQQKKLRLVLRKDIASLDEAYAILHALRKRRFHGQEGLFIVYMPEGTVIVPRPPSLAPPMAAPDPPRCLQAGSGRRLRRAPEGGETDEPEEDEEPLWPRAGGPSDAELRALQADERAPRQRTG